MVEESTQDTSATEAQKDADDGPTVVTSEPEHPEASAIAEGHLADSHVSDNPPETTPITTQLARRHASSNRSESSGQSSAMVPPDVVVPSSAQPLTTSAVEYLSQPYVSDDPKALPTPPATEPTPAPSGHSGTLSIETSQPVPNSAVQVASTVKEVPSEEAPSEEALSVPVKDPRRKGKEKMRVPSEGPSSDTPSDQGTQSSRVRFDIESEGSRYGDNRGGSSKATEQEFDFPPPCYGTLQLTFPADPEQERGDKPQSSQEVVSTEQLQGSNNASPPLQPGATQTVPLEEEFNQDDVITSYPMHQETSHRKFLKNYRDIRCPSYSDNRGYAMVPGTLVMFVGDTQLTETEPEDSTMFGMRHGDAYILLQLYGDLWASCIKLSLKNPVQPIYPKGRRFAKKTTTPWADSLGNIGFLPLSSLTLPANYADYMARHYRTTGKPAASPEFGRPVVAPQRLQSRRAEQLVNRGCGVRVDIKTLKAVNFRIMPDDKLFQPNLSFFPSSVGHANRSAPINDDNTASGRLRKRDRLWRYVTKRILIMKGKDTNHLTYKGFSRFSKYGTESTLGISNLVAQVDG